MVLAFLNQVAAGGQGGEVGVPHGVDLPVGAQHLVHGELVHDDQDDRGLLGCASCAFCATARWPSLSISVIAPTQARAMRMGMRYRGMSSLAIRTRKPMAFTNGSPVGHGGVTAASQPRWRGRKSRRRPQVRDAEVDDGRDDRSPLRGRLVGGGPPGHWRLRPSPPPPSTARRTRSWSRAPRRRPCWARSPARSWPSPGAGRAGPRSRSRWTSASRWTCAPPTPRPWTARGKSLCYQPTSTGPQLRYADPRTLIGADPDARAGLRRRARADGPRHRPARARGDTASAAGRHRPAPGARGHRPARPAPAPTSTCSAPAAA